MTLNPSMEQARFNMIEQQIRPWEVLDPAVLSLLAIVKREDFVPPALRALTFVDTEIALPASAGARECMLEPKLEARLLQASLVAHHETVLEVGAGSGYMAALLGHKARQVVTLETDPALARFAADNLRRAAVRNVAVRQLDGAAGLADEAPFDAIVLSGSVAAVPPALLAQLKIGGRLVAVVGELPVMRALRVTRTDAKAYSSVELFDTVAPRLHGFAEASRFRF